MAKCNLLPESPTQIPSAYLSAGGSTVWIFVLELICNHVEEAGTAYSDQATSKPGLGLENHSNS